MSRMTKFLKQTCSLEKYAVEENGQPSMNMFGELQYQAPITLKCRHEMSHKDVQTTNGSIVRSTSVYYVDESVEVKADYRIDGCVVLSAISYVNGLGAIEGYEVYV